MSVLPRLRPALRYLLAFADQGLSALLTFGVTLWLIRRGTADDLGAYVFWANVALVAGTIVSACSTVHLYRLPTEPAAREGAERAILSANLALAAVAGALAAAAVPLLGPPLDVGSAAILVPGSIVGLHARSLAASRGALGLSAAISTAAALALATILTAELFLDRPPSVALVLGGIGAVQAIAGAAVIGRLSGPAPLGWGPETRQLWRVTARRSGWMLLAGAANEVFTRAYIFVVPLRFGAPVLAELAAAQTLLRPATLIAGAFGSAVRVSLAARLGARDRRGFWRVLALGAAIPALATLAWSGVLAAVWPLVSRWIYGGRYADVAIDVLLWGGVLATSCLWVAGLVGLQALARLRALALAELGGALTCVAAMGPMLALLGVPGVLVAMVCGALVQVVLLFHGLRGGLREVGD